MRIVSRMKGELPSVSEYEKIKPQSEADLAESLTKEIDNWLNSGISGKYRKIEGFHASNTNECPRYLIYMFRGTYIPATHNARVQRIFDNGHATHDRLYKYFEGMGILVQSEIPISLSLESPQGLPVPIESTADGIIDWDGHKVIELKSIGDSGFMQRRMFKKPKPEHYRQIQIYMACLNLTSGYVIYENKNNQSILVLEVERDQEFLDKLLNKYGKIYQAYRDGKQSKRYKSPSSEHCKYCPLRDECWADTEEGIKI